MTIPKGARPPGTRKELHRGSLTPTKDGISSFNFDLGGLRISSDVVVQVRGCVVLRVDQPGDVVRVFLGARIHR